MIGVIAMEASRPCRSWGPSLDPGRWGSILPTRPPYGLATALHHCCPSLPSAVVLAPSPRPPTRPWKGERSVSPPSGAAAMMPPQEAAAGQQGQADEAGETVAAGAAGAAGAVAAANNQRWRERWPSEQPAACTCTRPHLACSLLSHHCPCCTTLAAQALGPSWAS